MTAAFRVLGIDASLRCTGLGVVEAQGSRLVMIDSGTVVTKASERRSECLRRIGENVRAIIARTAPTAAALESGFFHRNAKTADILGQVRGVVIAACADKGVPVFEYAPRRAKQAVVGYGAAEKEQVNKMLIKMLALTEAPQEDIGDALAIAVCHLHNRTSLAALAPEPV